jgi:disulfide bond formation protein DsbB
MASIHQGTEQETGAVSAASRTPLSWACAALAVSAIGLGGSLGLSLALKLKACPLCFYQRTFVMGVFAVLGVGLLADRTRAGFLCLLALPMTLGGLGVAAFHEYLVMTNTLECPNGLWGLGTAPAQSLGIFVVLTAVIGGGAWVGRRGSASLALPTVAGAAVLGLLLAWASVASSPPLPASPSRPYDPVTQPLDICRPPFRSS